MTDAQHASKRHAGNKAAGVVLLVMAVINIISSAGGSWAIATAGPELFGTDILAGTLLADKYWLVALALAFVGAVQLVALIVHLRRSRWAPTLHAFAGMTMMVFVFIEVLIINETFFLQPLFFSLGALQLSLSPLFFQMWRSTSPSPQTGLS